MRWRDLLGVAAGTALVALVALPAAAHTGAGAAFRGQAGPFTLNAFDGRTTVTTGEAEFRLVLQRAGDPVDDAKVTIEADLLDVPRQHAGPVTATSLANVYTYRLPDRGVIPWRVHVTVQDGRNTGEARFEVHGTPEGNRIFATPADEDDSGGLRTALIAITVGVVLAGVTAIVIRRTRADG